MAAFDNLSNPSEYLAYWGKTYRNELLSNILPFWMKWTKRTAVTLLA